MNLFSLWGKTMGSEGAVAIHPLLCHMVDVAEVTGALWQRCLGADLRRHVCTTLGCGDADARRILMFWAALHDLGKASPSFQRRYAPAIAPLEVEGLSFRRQYGQARPAYHGVISTWALGPLLARQGNLPRRWAACLAKASAAITEAGHSPKRSSASTAMRPATHPGMRRGLGCTRP